MSVTPREFPTSTHSEHKQRICQQTLARSDHASPASVRCESSLVNKLTPQPHGKGHRREGFRILGFSYSGKVRSVSEPNLGFKVIQEGTWPSAIVSATSRLIVRQSRINTGGRAYCTVWRSCSLCRYLRLCEYRLAILWRCFRQNRW